MATGGFNPSPQSFGASDGTKYEIYLNALNTADGDALDHEVDSFVYAENFAAARVLADLASDNIRLSYQFDPSKMTDFLPRWEKILNIIPDPSSDGHQRRLVVANKLLNYGNAPTHQVVNDTMESLLGGVFIDILNSNYLTASGSVPGGAVIPGGATLLDGDWRSTIASISILVKPLPAMTEQKFYNIVKNIDGVLEDLLPAWVGFNWVRDNSMDLCGFILDDPHNLDNEYFC